MRIRNQYHFCSSSCLSFTKSIRNLLFEYDKLLPFNAHRSYILSMFPPSLYPHIPHSSKNIFSSNKQLRINDKLHANKSKRLNRKKSKRLLCEARAFIWIFEAFQIIHNIYVFCWFWLPINWVCNLDWLSFACLNGFVHVRVLP